MVSIIPKAIYVLIGGGNTNLKSDKPYETKMIDQEIVKLTKKEHPNFLFIGLASSYSDAYYDNMKKIYQNLGCKCAYLKKKNIINNPDIVEKKITEADILYFAGGDTVKLLEELKEYQVDKKLIEKSKTNCIMVGISAGAICFTNKGFSDSYILRGKSEQYQFVNGLKMIDINFCPHYNIEERKENLKKTKTKEKIIAVENGCALVINKKQMHVIKETENNNAYICYYKDKWIEEKI